MGKGTVVPMPEDAPNIGDVYKHYKGDLYKIVGVALNSDNNSEKEEWMVIYEPMYAEPAAPLFSRPFPQWQETVEWEGAIVPRFAKQ